MSKQSDESNRKINQDIECLVENIDALDREMTELKFKIEKSHLDLILTLDTNLNTNLENLNIK